MAMPINSGPILTGESARAFMEEFERNNLLPRYELTDEEEEKLREIERKSHAFMEQLKKELREEQSL